MRPIAIACVVTLATLLAKPSWAQDSPAHPTRRELVTQAQQARFDGRHADALDLARRAGELSMTAGLQRFMAEEFELLGRVGEALEHAVRCVADAQREPPSPNRTVVEAGCVALQQRLGTRVGRVQLNVPTPAPSGLAISIASQPLDAARWNAIQVVSPGTVHIGATATDFAPMRRDVNVAPGETVRVDVALVPRAAAIAPTPTATLLDLRVLAIAGGVLPADLRVAVDGTAAPLNSGPQPVTPGPHAIDVSGSGILPMHQVFDLPAGQTTPLMIPLQPEIHTAEIAVVASVPRALVALDGEPIGPSPVVMRGLLPGPHLVSAQSSGYAVISQRVEGIAGRRTTVQLTLTSLVPRSRPAPFTPWFAAAVAGIGLGVIAVVVGSVAEVDAGGTYAATRQRCAMDPGCDGDWLNGQMNHVSTFDTVANATIIPGIVLLVAGAAIAIAMPMRRRSTERAWFTPSGAVVAF